jgi:F-type H+-transporting ATPase subunit epsilon
MKPVFKLTIVSQAHQQLSLDVESLTAPTVTGEVTILPHHSALFTPLQTGELTYRLGTEVHSLVISKGFMDIGPDNTVTVIVDEAVAARDISLQKAQEAIQKAQSVLISSRDREELLMAEASLRRALLEVKVAQKSKKTQL